MSNTEATVSSAVADVLITSVTEVDKAYLMHDWIDLFTIGSAAASSPPSSLLLQEESKLSSQKLPDNHADSANLCQYFLVYLFQTA
ncbi:hypothetical protein T03_7856 [Trichinella britovi]|uniref:Uncharacterized protein n=1 Tax=Trichinella britovi TaxID=45882 RepID=A0A0V1CRB7_TRIBR|nr:hypothetical protein T03_7856 [Trichinella britovi]